MPNKTKEPESNQQQIHKEQQHKQQNNQQSPQHQPKSMRRIQQRHQMPSDKAQLIQYLSQRIKQAQQALNDTQQLLESEIVQRQKIAKSIDERNQQLEKLYKVDQKALPQKIKQRLTEILTDTINQKLEAEEELNQQKSRNYEYKMRYGQLKHKQQLFKSKLEDLGSKQSTLNKQITSTQKSISQEEKQLKQLEEEFQAVKEKKEALEDKYLQMRVALQRMSDIKAVMNRFFGNEDLFDQKMDLKEQKVVRPQVTPNNEGSQQNIVDTRLPSRENRNVTKLKPLNNSRKRQVADDEDFWRGDFTAKTRNY